MDYDKGEISAYQGYLPQTVKYQRKGNTIIAESHREFDKKTFSIESGLIMLFTEAGTFAIRFWFVDSGRGC